MYLRLGRGHRVSSHPTQLTELFPTRKSISEAPERNKNLKMLFSVFPQPVWSSGPSTGLVSLSFFSRWQRACQGEKMQPLAAGPRCTRPATGKRGETTSDKKRVKHWRPWGNSKSPIRWWLSSLKDKWREKQRKRKNVSSRLNGAWNCITKPGSNTCFSDLDEGDLHQVRTILHLRKHSHHKTEVTIQISARIKISLSYL